MNVVELKKSEEYFDTYADFASFSPAAIEDNSLINIHFITNKMIPAIVGQKAALDDVRKSDIQIGSISELEHQCTVMMNVNQLILFRKNIDSLLEQLGKTQK